jgi:type IV pilus assembly protein PilQ
MASTTTTIATTKKLGVLLALVAGSTVAIAQESTAPAAEQAAMTAPAPAPTTAEAPEAMVSDEGVKVDDNMTVDLHVKDEDLANVLEMLSIQSQKNIIASKDVQARVTANLYGVTFYEALDAILNVNGYGFIEEGNFIKIYTLDELQKIQAAQRVKVSKMIGLNYMNAVDAAEFVKPLLSPEGQVKVNAKAPSFTASETPVGGEDYANGSMVVIYDFEENVAQVEEMLKQIDTRPSQVLVEATVLQTQLTEATALGVDFSIVADVSFDQFTGVLLRDPVSALLGAAGEDARRDRGATTIGSTVGNVRDGAGGFKVGVVSNDVAVFMRALDEVSDTTVLSNPKILTLNRMSARVLVGRKVGYLQTQLGGDSGQPSQQSVAFIDTGTQLSVRPFVSNDGMIRMELRPKVADVNFKARAVNGQSTEIPEEVTQELTTNIMVRDGQTIVLGGLFRENITTGRNQVPFLGDLPLIGDAFRGRNNDIARNEIIFLVTPTIVSDQAISEAGDRSKQFIDRTMFGARQSTLPWSRDRMTSALNIEADSLVRDGKTNEAMSRIERSLTLNSHQPEVLELRERLQGSKSKQINRSFLDRILRKEAADNLLKVEAQDELLGDAGQTSLPFEQPNEQFTTTDMPFPSALAEVQPEAAAVNFDAGVLSPAIFAEDFSFPESLNGEQWTGPTPFCGNLQQYLEFLASEQGDAQFSTVDPSAQ